MRKILETIAANFQDVNFNVGKCDKIQYCVAVKREAKRVRVTGTTLGNASKVLDFNPQEWASFVKGVKQGQFDVE
jgi:hypothetical protein